MNNIIAADAWHKLLGGLHDPATRTHSLTLLLIVLLGFCLRFYGFYVGQAYHYSAMPDEVAAYHMALRLLAGDPTAFYLGQPAFNSGNLPGPLWTLFWACAYKLGGNSIDGVIIMMILINSVTIWLVYHFARYFLNPAYALVSAFLYATGPWPIYFSVGTWNPLTLAFLGALLFLALWRVTQENNSRLIFWVCVLSAAALQFHMIGVFYFPSILLVLYLCPTTLNKKWFVAGIVAGLALYIPYLIGDGAQHWHNTKALLHGDPSHFSTGVLKILTIPPTLLSNHPGTWAGEYIEELTQFGDTVFLSIYVLLAINLIAFIVALFTCGSFVARFITLLFQQWRTPRVMFTASPVIAFLGVLILPSLLFYILTGHSYASRYAIIIMPLLFILPGLYLTRLSSRTKNIAFRFYLPLLTVFNLYLMIAYYTYMDKQFPIASHFMPSFPKLAQLEQDLENHAGKDAYIKIDTSEFNRVYETYDYITAAAVRVYVLSQQDYVRHPTPATKTVTYLLKYPKDIRHPGHVAFIGNGIALERRPD
jgi:4-amino-4-deoxy-L-arabinose transferase-like glycosyltransferase